MNITIAGGGIAGLSAAIALERLGMQVVLFEAASEIKSAGAGLGLAPNAIAALRQLGLADRVLPLGRQLEAFIITNKRGEIILKTNGAATREKYGVDNFTIHRAVLHKALLEAASSATIVTGKTITGLQMGDGQLQLSFSDNTKHETDFLLAADGINSRIRNALLPHAKKRYAGYTCWRGVVNAPDILMNEAIEIWDTSGRLGIVPLADGKVYWFACIAAKESDETFRTFTVQDLTRYFESFHRLAGELLSRTDEAALLHNDIHDLEPLPHYAFGNILLLGDAAHATTPNLAQGACQAIEDAAVLASVLRQNNNYTDAFIEFEQRRLKRTHYIINESRKLGRVAQISNPLLARIRDQLLPLVPDHFKEKQLHRLYDTA
jgi:2-polyprenyl-6-methoxyphenol hydroxylase-like FAD-dependent oxidoreductase